MTNKIKLWGGIGEKKSNNGTQWYQQNRIYDITGICPSLTTFKSDHLIAIPNSIKKNKKNNKGVYINL